MECTICMNIFEDNIFSTYCGHLYCKPCADNMVVSSTTCWACQSPIAANMVHKIYVPESSRRDNNEDSNDLTKDEILRTMFSDLEIECEKTKKECAKLQDVVHTYEMNYANFVSLNEELKKKNELLHEKLLLIQTRLDRCEQIVNEYDKTLKVPPKRVTRSSAI